MTMVNDFDKRRSPTDSSPEMAVDFGGYLFLANDSNSVNEYHTGLLTVDGSISSEWLRLLAYRCGYMSTRRIDYLFLIAPDKQTVLRHRTPENFNFRPSSFILQHPNVIDPAPLLLEMSKFVDVYPKTDSHWDHLGAFAAVQLIAARFNIPISIPEVRWHLERKEGDLGKKQIPPIDSEWHRAIFAAKSKIIYRNNIPNNGNINIYAKPNDAIDVNNARTLLIFGDSFCYDIVHFLRELFDIVVHVHYSAVDFDLIDIVRPTHVISELTERFMVRLPSPSDGQPIKAVWFEKATREEGATQDGVASTEYNAFSLEAIRTLDEITQLFEPFRSIMAPATQRMNLERRVTLLKDMQRSIYSLAGVDAAYQRRTAHWLAELERRL